MSKKRKKVKTHKYEGLPVVDATSPIEIHITRSDVNHAKKSDPANCAAAIACKREHKKEVRIFLTTAYVKEKNHWTRYAVPQRISREIISFDRGSDFVPGDYKVSPFSPSNRLGKRQPKRGEGGSHAKNKNLMKRPYHHTANVREFDKSQLEGK